MLLREFCSMQKTDNGYLIHGDAADVMLVFLSDDVIRIRVSFDRKFEEASYTLVTTAWEDRILSMVMPVPPGKVILTRPSTRLTTASR